MQIDKKTIRHIFFLASGCIVLYWLLHETERFKALWGTLCGMIAPFVIGAVIAFILNVPLRAVERHLKWIENNLLRRVAGVLITFALFLLILFGVFNLLLPQLSETVQTLIPKLSEFFLKIEASVQEMLNENPELLQWFQSNTEIQSFDWAGIIQQAATVLKSSVAVIVNGAYNAVGSVITALINMVIGIVFAFYCLGRKEILARQGRRLLYATLPEGFVDELIRILRLANSTFSNFISGQCLEALILGCLFAIAMAILKMPYISLISVLIAVTSMVPLVGAFIGCVVGAFLILVTDPLQAVVFVVMFLILQQIEGNLIYPKVVGTSIGLPGMWVLVAVTVGGELMGIVGMFIMIPISSVIYTLLRDYANRRLAQRNIDPEKLRDHPPELISKFKEKRERKKKQRLLKQVQELAQHHYHGEHQEKKEE